MPIIDGLPIPEALRQVPPRAARPGTEEDPVDHRPVIGPPAALPRTGGQERPQPLPLLISQVMAFQSLKHRTDLQHQASKIHGTRPNGNAGRDVLIRPSPGAWLNRDQLLTVPQSPVRGQRCAPKTSTPQRAAPLRSIRASAVTKETWRTSARATYCAS